MEDSRLNRSMLLDFYGELLTEKQREYYDLHYNEDLSLYEIAEHTGVSRQAVWDNIRRAETALQEMEEKTGLVARALHRREVLGEMEALIAALPDSEIRAALAEKLDALKD